MDKKFKIILIILLVVAVVGVATYFILKNQSEEDEEDDNESNSSSDSSSGNTSTGSSSINPNPHLYPIKKGVKNSEVKLLQQGLIKAFGAKPLEPHGADGKWGTNTDNLVKEKLNKSHFHARGEWIAALNKAKGIPYLSNMGAYFTKLLF